MGCGTLRGDGYSLVARESQAALSYLYAIEQRELEEAEALAQQQQQEEQEGEQADDGDAEPAVVGEGEEEEAVEDATQVASVDGVEVSPLPEWRPSPELMARQPALLRIPFLLEGAWVGTDLILTKRHLSGVNNEIRYSGSLTRADGAASTFSLHLECPFAAATLSLTCDPQRAPISSHVPLPVVAAIASGASRQQQRAEGQEEEGEYEEADDANSGCGSLEQASAYSSVSARSSPGAPDDLHSSHGSPDAAQQDHCSRSLSPNQFAVRDGSVASAAAAAAAAIAPMDRRPDEQSASPSKEQQQQQQQHIISKTGGRL